MRHIIDSAALLPLDAKAYRNARTGPAGLVHLFVAPQTLGSAVEQRSNRRIFEQTHKKKDDRLLVCRLRSPEESQNQKIPVPAQLASCL